MVGRRRFLGVTSLGLVVGWAETGRGQVPDGANGPTKVPRRMALRPILPMEPVPPIRADEGLNKRLAELVERHKIPGIIAALVQGVQSRRSGRPGCARSGRRSRSRSATRCMSGHAPRR